MYIQHPTAPLRLNRLKSWLRWLQGNLMKRQRYCQKMPLVFELVSVVLVGLVHLFFQLTNIWSNVFWGFFSLSGIATSISKNKKHLNAGWDTGVQRKESVYKDFTLGQMYSGIAVIQRHSRNYLKYLKQHVTELRYQLKQKKTSQLSIGVHDSRKKSSVIVLQKWYRRIRARRSMSGKSCSGKNFIAKPSKPTSLSRIR